MCVCVCASVCSESWGAHRRGWVNKRWGRMNKETFTHYSMCFVKFQPENVLLDRKLLWMLKSLPFNQRSTSFQASLFSDLIWSQPELYTFLRLLSKVKMKVWISYLDIRWQKQPHAMYSEAGNSVKSLQRIWKQICNTDIRKLKIRIKLTQWSKKIKRF